MVTKEDLDVVAVAALGGGQWGGGRGEAWGTEHLRFTSPRGLSLRENKERPGGGRGPTGGSAGTVDGSPGAP